MPPLEQVLRARIRLRFSISVGARDSWSRCLNGALAGVMAHRDPQAWIDPLCLSSLVITSAVGEAPVTRLGFALNSGIRPNGLPIVTRLKDRTRHRNPRSNSVAAQQAGYTHSSRKELFAVLAPLSISSLLWFRRPRSLMSPGACTLVLSRHTKTPLTGFAVLTQEPSRPSSRTWYARRWPVSLPLRLQRLAVCDHPVSKRPRAIPRATRRSGFSLRSSSSCCGKRSRRRSGHALRHWMVPRRSGAFAVLRSCTGWAKILYSCGTVSPQLPATSLGMADRDIRHSPRLVGSFPPHQLTSVSPMASALAARWSMPQPHMSPAWPHPRSSAYDIDGGFRRSDTEFLSPFQLPSQCQHFWVPWLSVSEEPLHQDRSKGLPALARSWIL